MPIAIGRGAGYGVVDPSRGDAEAQLIIQDSLERRHDLENISIERNYLPNTTFHRGKRALGNRKRRKGGIVKSVDVTRVTYTYAPNVKEENLGLFFWHLCWTEIEIIH